MSESRFPLRKVMSDALGFWEPRRIAYNMLLLIIAIAFLSSDWRHGEVDADFQLFALLAAYLVLANLLFCAAYLSELLAARLDCRLQWQRWRNVSYYAALVVTIALSCRFFVNVSNDFF